MLTTVIKYEKVSFIRKRSTFDECHDIVLGPVLYSYVNICNFHIFKWQFINTLPTPIIVPYAPSLAPGAIIFQTSTIYMYS